MTDDRDAASRRRILHRCRCHPLTVIADAFTHDRRTSNDERALLVIEATHAQLTVFANTSYIAEGRGVIQLAVPSLRPGQTTIIDTHMVYLTLNQVGELVSALGGPARDDGDALIRVMETYDPAHQALVSIAVGRARPVTVQMELDHPLIHEQVDGVH